ncbi:hypothetical protein M23134_06903 [Microscilla marina ATCC 23134]|uniref:Uncharacterized protein n=1 Tax=Microscilla marina ATCC 23134 TaxID=313606 RepID=A1ZQ93_MICM2|nr:hypothetical protein M23134_06903 [Microscilla marina ATCC 23134]
MNLAKYTFALPANIPGNAFYSIACWQAPHQHSITQVNI